MPKKKPEMPTFTVKRSEWLRGEGPVESYLLRPDHNTKRCCLGFRALQLGHATDEQIRGLYDHISLIKRFPDMIKYWRSMIENGLFSSAVAKGIMGVNDDKDLTDKQREAQLKKLFKSIGEEIVFVD